ncbi:ketohexokinase [Elysia marginata]|uniref:Ketohexokinase n=1 Tax=Elysia marginata TaxID=1093978 RepID=A0AAV4EMN8_9GAST|nr:ketohexokinase [Elysia marginata]
MDGQFRIDGKKRTVFVGLVCVDILNLLPKYPEEDIGHRCIDYYKQRGGNASNSSSIFSLLGGDVEFFGTLASDPELPFIQKDFEKFGVKFQNSILASHRTCPMSIVILSLESHTRTVLHTNKDLPELTRDDFAKNINLKSSQYGWIHFEGRDNAQEIAHMMTYVNDFNEKNSTNIFISLEAEKLRFARYLDEFDMWKMPDVLFVSKDFALSQGYTNMEQAASNYFQKVKKGAVVICAWGEKGAAAMSDQSGLVTSPAFPPTEILDTCGAGDTFNAATLFALGRGKALQTAIEFGCKIAGSKCGIMGLNNLTLLKDTFAHIQL